jgi:hypothetical protein
MNYQLSFPFCTPQFILHQLAKFGIDERPPLHRLLLQRIKMFLVVGSSHNFSNMLLKVLCINLLPLGIQIFRDDVQELYTCEPVSFNANARSFRT